MITQNKTSRDLTEEEQSEIIFQHAENNDKYKKLCNNVKEAIEQFLEKAELSYLTVHYRIKDFSSILSKVKRKRYQNVFDECEDTCGVRIICYFQDDIEKINAIIKKEFEIINTSNLISGSEKFGYRSYHFVVKIKKAWTNAPNYRGLENLKIEIQVRTVLMHAWAEIEHKLAYKRREHIPVELRRTFSKISLKLEEADEQFENLRESMSSYKKNARENILKKDFKADVNLDNLQALLDAFFPTRKKDIKNTSGLLDDILKHGFSMSNLAGWLAKNSRSISNLEKEVFFSDNKEFFAQIGAARMSIVLGNDEYMREILPSEIISRVEEFKAKHSI